MAMLKQPEDGNDGILLLIATCQTFRRELLCEMSDFNWLNKSYK